MAQTVLDLSSIEPDVRITGSGINSVLSRSAVLDFDDSGIPDLVVADYDYDYQENEAQCVFVFLDFSVNHPDPVINLSEGGYDLVFAQNIWYGIHLGVLAIGDWNHDGVDDLALGDPKSHEPGYIPEGTAYVFWGGSQWQSGEVIDLQYDQPDIFINSSDFSDDPEIGTALTSLDFNNDGIDDLAVSGLFATNNAGGNPGAVYVIYGSESFTDPVVIDTTQGDQDLTIYGATDWSRFGMSISAGDVNGDGIDDLVAGAPQAWFGDDYGAMYVVFGSESFPPHHVIDLGQTDAGLTVIGNQQGGGGNGSFGRRVTSGDYNGDGIYDICAGDYTYDDALARRGAAHLIWGDSTFQPGTVIDLRTTMADVMFVGGTEFSYLGDWVSSGDLNNDGFDELSVSCPKSYEQPQSDGEQIIFTGLEATPDHYVVDLSKKRPTIKMLSESEGDGGGNLQMLDIDGDGFRDLVFGNGWASTSGTTYGGTIYIFYSDGSPIDRPPRVLAGPGPHPTNPPELRMWDPFYNADGWSERLRPYLVRGYGLNPGGGDLDGDGYDELLMGPGPGPNHPAMVSALDTKDGRQWQFQAYGTPKYGVNLAAGDLDGDGNDEIITGAGPGAVYGPHVRGWTLSGDQVVPLGNVSFLAYGTHRWGVNVACGDIDGDGFDEIVTGAGPGDVFGPHVRGWNVDGGTASPMPGVSFLAYGTPRWGVNVACGDIDGDGIDEIVTGPGPSEVFGAHVRGWNCDGGSVASIPGVNFFAFQGSSRAMGCVVACGDLDNDHIDEILTVPGPHPDNPASLKSWNYDGEALTQIERMSFLLFEEGEYVAGARLAFGNFYQSPPFLP